MKLEGVRTRFAPSPTGYMHVGNLRTALYAYLMAKSQGGTLFSASEDTDQERYVEGAVDIIYNTLKEAGLYWDKGRISAVRWGLTSKASACPCSKNMPTAGESGHAYYCFCDKDRLEEVRVLQKASGIVPSV